MKVLLVDDEAGIRKVLAITLADAGHEVHTAKNAVLASNMVKELVPDLVLTDIRMPGMDGIELLKFIKENSPETEVIMITGHGDLELAIESLKLDAVDFISKPINHDILAIALKRAQDKIDTRRKLDRYTRDLESLIAEKTRKLAVSEQRYMRLFNNSPAFITILDREFKILESNDRFKEVFGDPDLGCCYRVVKKRPKPCPDCPVAKTFETGESHTAEMEIQLDDGEVHNLFIQTSAITDENGHIHQVMEMATDVTEFRELQDHLAALGLHISTISHGIKGILTGMDGGDYLISTGLERGNLDQVETGWDIVKEKINIIRHMILGILYHSKNRDLECKPVALFDFIQELVTTLAPKMKSLDIDLELDIPKPNEGVTAEMDATVMFAALLAILENAVDACASAAGDRERLVISLHASSDDQGTCFRIRDNGIGMSRSYRKEAFSLFYSKKGRKGTGLGLFIAHRSVKQHRGEIRIDSQPGVFTEFTITLPIPEAVNPEAP